MIQKKVANTRNVGIIELSSDSNSIKMYDTDDLVVIDIDDSNAIDEGTFETQLPFYDDNGNPWWVSTRNVGGTTYYTYLTMGPGIQVGYGINDAAGFTTIGRKKIFTTGRVQAAQIIEGNNRKLINQDVNCVDADRIIILVVSSGTRTVYLPTSPLEGKNISVIFKISGGTGVVNGSGHDIITSGNTTVSSFSTTVFTRANLVYMNGVWEVI